VQETFLNYFKYFFYGIVQGFTEFLPISSTAHLKVLSEFFNLGDPGSSLSAIIQIGSVFAVLIFFQKEILTSRNKVISYSSFSRKKIFLSILLGTTFILFFGALVKFIIPDFYNSYLRSNLVIALISIFTGLLMYISELKRCKNISLKNHNFTNSLFIGLAQAFAIIPGVSRSGITITAALLLGWKKVDAAKYSFLLGIPAISIASFVEIYSSLNIDLHINFGPLILALISSFITSYLSIKFLIRYISIKGLKFFIYYKIIFGSLILVSEYSLFKFH
tara:strand:+ start:5038 stop:5868 length:831 start_codon:yes stop_codon:yes gene_type:complete